MTLLSPSSSPSLTPDDLSLTPFFLPFLPSPSERKGSEGGVSGNRRGEEEEEEKKKATMARESKREKAIVSAERRTPSSSSSFSLSSLFPMRQTKGREGGEKERKEGISFLFPPPPLLLFLPRRGCEGQKG